MIGAMYVKANRMLADMVASILGLSALLQLKSSVIVHSTKKHTLDYYHCRIFFGFLWIPMDSFGLLWVPFDSYGLLMVPVSIFGFLWDSLSSFRIL